MVTDRALQYLVLSSRRNILLTEIEYSKYVVE